MKEELQGKLVEILTSIQSAAGKASDFAINQLPDIAQSYVLYGRVSSALSVAIGLALVIGAPVVWLHGRAVVAKAKVQYMAVNDGRAPQWFQSYDGTPHNILAGFAALTGGFWLFVSVNSALLVWFAPKVWLLKEIAGMLK